MIRAVKASLYISTPLQEAGDSTNQCTTHSSVQGPDNTLDLNTAAT